MTYAGRDRDDMRAATEHAHAAHAGSGRPYRYGM